MAALKKHFGVMKNTGQRVVVVFMQLPDAPDHALVVSTDNLPTRFESALMSIAESPEGQGTHKLFEVLNRRLDPSTGKNMLISLHEANLLVRAHIDNVIMMPTPSYPFPLRKVLEGMVGQGTALPIPASRAPESAIRQYAGETRAVEESYKHNQYQENSKADAQGARNAIARNLILEAEMLESEARRKYEQAYQYEPSARPAGHRPTSLSMASADAMRDHNQTPAYNQVQAPSVPPAQSLRQEPTTIDDATRSMSDPYAKAAEEALASYENMQPGPLPEAAPPPAAPATSAEPPRKARPRKKAQQG